MNKHKKRRSLIMKPEYNNRHHYWTCKIDLANIDALGRPIENPTVQIDVESGKRFDISYLGEDGKQHNPAILHCSPTKTRSLSTRSSSVRPPLSSSSSRTATTSWTFRKRRLWNTSPALPTASCGHRRRWYVPWGPGPVRNIKRLL